MQCHTLKAAKINLDWWMRSPCDGTRQRQISTSDFSDVVSFTFVCTLVYLDHTVVLVQLDVQSTVGELAGTYREPSQDFRGLDLQLVDTISSRLHTVADICDVA